jgi:DNA-binding Lrp family transcriptional regulator|tara:strand:+ start:706 stop:1689 length:984 start_codon:yes stop_codon:yes gene_type:complete
MTKIHALKHKEKEIKLDLIDKKLLTLLYINSRERLKVFAKKLKISESNVLYRINRLKKLISLEFVILPNYSSLGIKMNLILIKNRLNSKDYKEIYETFSESDNIFYWLNAIGSYSHVIFVFNFDNDILDLSYKLHSITNDVKIQEINELNLSQFSMFNLDINFTGTKSQKIKLTKEAIRIIEAFINNPEAKTINIAEITKLSVPTIIKYERELFKKNILIPTVHSNLLGKFNGYCMFYKIGSKKSAEKLKKYLDNHKHHNFIFEIIGECEVFSLFFTENFSKVLEELEHVRNIDEIIDVEILQIQSQEPIVLFNEKIKNKLMQNMRL